MLWRCSSLVGYVSTLSVLHVDGLIVGTIGEFTEEIAVFSGFERSFVR